MQRWLPEETANAIAALHVPGLGFQTEPKRLYPNDSIGASVLGFVNDDGTGVNGVEGFYDAALRGTPGRLVVERDHDPSPFALAPSSPGTGPVSVSKG